MFFPFHDLSRGGFQNRDIGKTNYNFDLGPDYGIDFANFVRPLLSPSKDKKLHDKIFFMLKESFPINEMEIDIFVRNGFVFLKGFVTDSQSKSQIEMITHSAHGVETVINLLKVKA